MKQNLYVHLLHECCLKINPSVTPSNETAAPKAPPHVKCGASPEPRASMGAEDEVVVQCQKVS